MIFSHYNLKFLNAKTFIVNYLRSDLAAFSNFTVAVDTGSQGFWGNGGGNGTKRRLRCVFQFSRGR